MRVEVVGGVILLLVVIIVVAVANRPDPEPEDDVETETQNTENQNQDQQDQNQSDDEIIEENPLPPGETELPSCSETGTINKFYYASNPNNDSYPKNVDESIKVECSNGKCPVYDFVHFNLDSGRDLVTIYDSETSDASKIIFQNPLGAAHGVAEENDEAGLGIVGQATSSKMLVRFESDRFDTEHTGWKMDWSCCHECGLTEMPESAAVKK